jgi:outer membrane protein TolC
LQAQREAQKSYDLSVQLYKAGSIDFQILLNTQNSLFNAQDNYASVKLDMLNAAVDLYKALSCGWKSGPDKRIENC